MAGFDYAVAALVALLTVDAFLVLMHFISFAVPSPFDNLQLWFDLDGDQSIASWFSSSQLLVSGLLFFFAAWWRWHDRLEGQLFAVAGLAFCFLSADETVMIHERVTAFTAKYDFVPRFEGDHGVWIFAYGAIGVVLLLAFSRHVFALMRQRPMVAAFTGGGFATLLLGAVTIEVLGYYGVLTGPLQVAIEECLEMVGGSLIVCGALGLALSIVPSLVPASASSRQSQ